MMPGMSSESEQRETAGVPVPPPLIYLAGLLLGWGLERLVPTPDLPRPAAVAAGVIGAAAAGVLGLPAIQRFIRHGTAVEPWKPATALVTTGPYRFTRNPMYVGMACAYAGVALAFGLLWALLLLAVVLAVVDRLVIAREERYLDRLFGEDYRRYRGEVRRWL
jgi:protein-S-isoprenylcysteine O-methyltransferase Ste14